MRRTLLQCVGNAKPQSTWSYGHFLLSVPSVVFGRGMSAMERFETIRVQRYDAVRLITLDRPYKLNALSTKCCDELLWSLKEADSISDIHVTVLTGSGKVFCAGADIAEMSTWTAESVKEKRNFHQWTDIKNLQKPVIAAVNGAAMGGGCELALLCDIIVASERATFSQPETSVGLIPGMGGTQRLVRAVGKSKAMELILTGDVRGLSASEALQYGLVSRVVPHETLLEVALQLARKIAERSSPIVIKAKRCINDAYETGLQEGLKAELQEFWSCFELEDSKEGLLAFVNKRKPEFSNK